MIWFSIFRQYDLEVMNSPGTVIVLSAFPRRRRPGHASLQAFIAASELSQSPPRQLIYCRRIGLRNKMPYLNRRSIVLFANKQQLHLADSFECHRSLYIAGVVYFGCLLLTTRFACGDEASFTLHILILPVSGNATMLPPAMVRPITLLRVLKFPRCWFPSTYA